MLYIFKREGEWYRTRGIKEAWYSQYLDPEDGVPNADPHEIGEKPNEDGVWLHGAGVMFRLP